MHVKRVQILNFRNFANLDVCLSDNSVIVGENRVGKSNFLFALRLVLDSSLPDSARQLKMTDIWDGVDLTVDPRVEVHVDLADFDGDPNLTSVLTDYRLASDCTISRLSYVFEKKPTVTGPPLSEADFEFKLFGGGDETRSIRPNVRQRICLDLLHALRDAEAELGTWRGSPLRPLLEDAIGRVPKVDLDTVAADLTTATTRLGSLGPISVLESDLRNDIAALAGAAQDIKAKLGFAPTDPLRLFRSIGLFIDDGKRSVSDASLGSANLALLALRLAEFAWRRKKNERNYTLVCVEEPEAHLHPHLQRTIFQKLLGQDPAEPRGLILTTHSPNVAGVAPLRSIVLLKGTSGTGTQALSLANLPLEAAELEDLQRYLDVTRAEILFSRGVIFVEGDAEEALLPVFTRSLGIDLDELGISVCNVGGTNFRPYVRLAAALTLPFAVITDWDPLDGSRPPLGRKRALDLVDDLRARKGLAPLEATKRTDFETNESKLRTALADDGIFLNASTLELEIAHTPTLVAPLLSILDAGNFGALRRKRLEQWRTDPSSVNGEQLLAMVADIGKGRLAGRLAAASIGLSPPAYIGDAITYVATRVS